MRTGTRMALAALLLSLTGCPDDPTQVMVVVQADATVAAAGGRLRIEAFGGDSLDALTTVAIEDVVATYPYVLAIAPRNDDTSRAWRVVVRLEGATIDPVVASASGVFAPGEVKRLDVVLQAACAGVSCDPGLTCGAGDCASETVDTASLPDFDGPGPGIVDAGGGSDAPMADAGVDAGPADAGPDGGDDAGEDAGPEDAGPEDAGPEDAGTDAPPTDGGPCGDPCHVRTPCYDGTIVCAAELSCDEEATPRMSGTCGAGTCNTDGYCALEPITTNRAPADHPTGTQFAEHLDLSGTRLIAGSGRPTVDGIARAGRVFVYRMTPEPWALEAELPRPTPTPAVDDEFGMGVALDGDLAVAHYQRGFAVYQRDADTGWEFIETIDGGTDPLEGPIALDGDRVAAAAEDGLRIWEREGGAFVEKFPDTRRCAQLEDVAIAGDLIVLGCFDDTAQVYARTAGGSWTFRTSLDASWLDFGTSVDVLEGTPNRILVGALGFLSSTRTDGRAFLYEMGGSPATWNLVAGVQPYDQNIDEAIRFGLDVALLDDGRFAVSAPLAFWGAGAGAPDSGIVYVFERDRLGSWVEALRFTSTLRVSAERFGDAISASGSLLAASSNDTVGAEDNGAFRVFDLSP